MIDEFIGIEGVSIEIDTKIIKTTEQIAEEAKTKTVGDTTKI